MKKTDVLTVGDKRRAFETGADPYEVGDRASRIFSTKHTPTEQQIFAAGFRLATGDQSLMIIDLATGYTTSLVRTLNIANKRQGEGRRWQNASLNHAFVAAALPSLSAAMAARKIEMNPKRDAGDVNREGTQAGTVGKKRRGAPTRATAQEIDAEVSRLQALALKRRRAEIDGIKRKAKARRERARAIRWQLVPGQPRRPNGLEKFAGAAFIVVGLSVFSAAPIIVAGGIVLLAILAEGGKVRLRTELKLTTKTTVKQDLDAYFVRVRSMSQFDLNTIPREMRGVAGLYFSLLSRGQSGEKIAMRLDAAAPGLSSRIAELAEIGAPPGLARILLKAADAEINRAQRSKYNRPVVNPGRGGLGD
jgi:hypothetical protein